MMKLSLALIVVAAPTGESTGSRVVNVRCRCSRLFPGNGRQKTLATLQM